MNLSSGPAPSLVAQGKFHPHASLAALAAFSSCELVELPTTAVSIPNLAANAPSVLAARGKLVTAGSAATFGMIVLGSTIAGITTPAICLAP